MNEKRKCCHNSNIAKNFIIKKDAIWVIQGWKSLDTVIAAESLALTLQASSETKQSKELLERLFHFINLSKLVKLTFAYAN